MAGRFAQQPDPSRQVQPRKPAKRKPTKTVADEAAQRADEMARRADQAAAALTSGAKAANEALALDEDFERNPITKAAFFTAQRRLTRRHELLQQLTEASRGMVAAYRSLLEERHLWERLARQDFDTHKVGLRGQVLLLEAAQQQLVPMLDHLGYGDGPPPAEEWVELIQQPLRILLHGVRPEQAAGLAADAEHNLRQLVGRLDRLVEVANQRAHLGPNSELTPALKSRLSRMLAAARDQVAPALIIAYASTSIGVAVIGDPATAAAAGAAAAVAKGIELGAAGRIAQRKAPQDADIEADLRTGLSTLEDCVRLAGDPPRDDDYGALLVRRASMQLVLDAAQLEDSHANERWLKWVDEVERVLHDPHFEQSSALELYGSAQLLIEVTT